MGHVHQCQIFPILKGEIQLGQQTHPWYPLAISKSSDAMTHQTGMQDHQQIYTWMATIRNSIPCAKHAALQHCPSCQQQAETTKHFLQCPHPQWQQIWEELISQIQWLSYQHWLSQAVQDHMTQGIQSVTMELTPLPVTNPNQIMHYSKQQLLGWRQMLYGQYSQQWIKVINQHINLSPRSCTSPGNK